MRSRGVDAAELIASLDCDWPPTEGSTTSLEDYGRAYRFFMAHMPGRHFGFDRDLGEILQRFQMLYMLLVNCKTLGLALKRLHQFYEAFGIVDKMLSLQEIDGKTVALDLKIYTSDQHRGSERETLTTGNLSCAVYRLACWLVGRPIPLSKVELRGPAPAQAKAYDKLFHCPIHFAGETTRLYIKREALDFRIVRSETSLLYFQDTLFNILFTDPMRELSVAQKIENLIGDDFKRSRPPQREMAAMLGLTEIKLRQALHEEGLSYTDIYERCRHHYAKIYLDQAQLSINEISELLGFPATSAFYRSFKRWQGITPGQYRKA